MDKGKDWWTDWRTFLLMINLASFVCLMLFLFVRGWPVGLEISGRLKGQDWKIQRVYEEVVQLREYVLYQQPKTEQDRLQ